MAPHTPPEDPAQMNPERMKAARTVLTLLWLSLALGLLFFGVAFSFLSKAVVILFASVWFLCLGAAIYIQRKLRTSRSTQ